MTVNIIYRGLPLTVGGTYHKEERAVMYYKNGDGYPGAPAEFEIESVKLGEQEMIDFLDELYEKNELSHQYADSFLPALDEIESLCIEAVGGTDEYAREDDDI